MITSGRSLLTILAEDIRLWNNIDQGTVCFARIVEYLKALIVLNGFIVSTGKLRMGVLAGQCWNSDCSIAKHVGWGIH